MLMKSPIIYRVKVTKPLMFLEKLIDVLPTDTLISFEGNLSEILTPKFLVSNVEQKKLIRNTRTPKSDLWIFHLDEPTREYLKSDFLKRIGIKTNVNHVLAFYEGALIFSSYDNFHSDSVQLTQTNTINDRFIGLLVDENILEIHMN